ncbi:carotenoid 1,2-hydratase [Piscinibacter sakaiensis]|uniref:Hydroxyneurosporene dehydrogenase n=1 Tax=Piscinibacter sakaiensis TaxID=1547922 RepID=A0A0K8NWU0_PISS1|nr:carotenoid 1,2-hydratase [Piscinibacter sakaiensis]GAP34405.1 hydroxyneurosporene dehydrogenase [Piscinibacter sakaiensis]
MSEDGRHALTLIAFLGSVFSPYYAWARRRGPTDPLAHCAVNVALYGPGGRWAMTERGARSVERDARQLRIGRSRLQWCDEGLAIDIDEVAAPWPRPLRGRILLRPGAAWGHTAHALDAAGRHRWSPLAPWARAEVQLSHPAWDWQGPAYLDANAGDRPLEADFEAWSWSRLARADGGCRLAYDVLRRDGSRHGLALEAGPGEPLRPAEPAAWQALPRSGWGLARPSRGPAVLERTLEDGPFYARTLLRGADGAPGVHESLSLQRFRRRWVQALLPFRMPRRA